MRGCEILRRRVVVAAALSHPCELARRYHRLRIGQPGSERLRRPAIEMRPTSCRRVIPHEGVRRQKPTEACAWWLPPPLFTFVRSYACRISAKPQGSMGPVGGGPGLAPVLSEYVPPETPGSEIAPP